MVQKFDRYSDNFIKKFMSENPYHPNPFEELSRMTKYTAKQIKFRWHNYLDPRFYHGERMYIYDWAVKNYRVGKIRPEIKERRRYAHGVKAGSSILTTMEPNFRPNLTSYDRKCLSYLGLSL